MHEQQKMAKINNLIKKIKSKIKKEKFKISFFKCKLSVSKNILEDYCRNSTGSNIFIIFISFFIVFNICIWESNLMKLNDVSSLDMTFAIVITLFLSSIVSLCLVSELCIYLSRVHKFNNKEILKIIYPLKDVINQKITVTVFNEKAIYLINHYDLYSTTPLEEKDDEMLKSADVLVENVISYLESQVNILNNEIKRKVRQNVNVN